MDNEKSFRQTVRAAGGKGFVVSLAVNVLTQADVQKAIENIVLFAGYSGVVIGWFGGLLFLMRHS